MVDDGAFSFVVDGPLPVRACGDETGAAYTIPCEGAYEGMYVLPCACGACDACGACGALADAVGPDAPFTLSCVVD